MSSFNNKGVKELTRNGKIWKVYDRNKYNQSYVFMEAVNIARVAESGVKVPKVIKVEETKDGWTIVMDKIEGKTMQELIRENPEKEDEYLKQFVKLQLDIGSHTCRYLKDQRERMIRKLSEANLDSTVLYDLNIRLAGMPVHDKLCHGSFSPSNVIVTESGEMYVTDWTKATQGNISADAARSYLGFYLYNGQKRAEKYLDLFCELSGISRQYVQSWMPIVAAVRSVNAKPKEKEFLKQWYTVVDYV